MYKKMNKHKNLAVYPQKFNNKIRIYNRTKIKKALYKMILYFL